MLKSQSEEEEAPVSAVPQQGIPQQGQSGAQNEVTESEEEANNSGVPSTTDSGSNNNKDNLVLNKDNPVPAELSTRKSLSLKKKLTTPVSHPPAITVLLNKDSLVLRTK